MNKINLNLPTNVTNYLPMGVEVLKAEQSRDAQCTSMSGFHHDVLLFFCKTDYGNLSNF